MQKGIDLFGVLVGKRYDALTGGGVRLRNVLSNLRWILKWRKLYIMLKIVGKSSYKSQGIVTLWFFKEAEV